MKNDDESIEKNHNPNWLYIIDHPYRILIIGGSGSSKTNALLNLIKNQQWNIDKIYLYVKNTFESNRDKKINHQTLKNFSHMSKIHSNQSINYLLTEQKK